MQTLLFLVLSFAVEIYEKNVYHVILLYFVPADMVWKVPTEDKVIIQVIPCQELIVSLHLCFDIGRSDELFNE